MSPRRLTIVFSGMIAGDPHQGGAAWAVLQYILGLRKLGHHVFFVEPIRPASVGPPGASFEESDNAAYFRRVVGQFGIGPCSAFLLTGSKRTVGLQYDDLRKIARRADLLLNVSGMLTDGALIDCIPTRAFIDLDPAFVQLWQSACGIDMHFDAHTHFVTVGQLVGRAGCNVPTCGRQWVPTFQPVVLELWPAVPASEVTYDAFTTIGNWRGYGSIEHDGIFYGQKAHSMRQIIDLPTHASEQFLLAMGIHAAETNDLAALSTNGWRRIDPRAVAGTPDDYRRFIQSSKAEFGIAKSGYVASRCGWFSDRSACYLASSRPVLAQDTGFTQVLPAGTGLLAFTNRDDACDAIESIRRDYPRHCRAARSLAEQWFDSDRVLGALLDGLGVT